MHTFVAPKTKRMNIIITFVALCLATFSFAQKETSLKGKIINANYDKVTLSQIVEEKGRPTKKTLAESEVNKEGAFEFQISLEEQVEAIFNDGNEQTTVLLQPGDDIYMTLNTKMFDETISYYGTGAEKNNAIKTTWR